MKKKKYQLTKKVLLFGLSLFFLFYICLFSQENKPLARLVSQIVLNWHIQPQKLNDATSNRIFELYIKTLDPRKVYFTQNDIKILSKYRFKQDEAIKDENLEFVTFSHSLLLKRLKTTKESIHKILSKPISIKDASTLHINPDNRNFPINKYNKYHLWKHLLSLNVMNTYLELYQTKHPDFNKNTISKLDETLEKEARESVKKEVLRQISRIENYKPHHFSALWIDAFSNAHDPHTTYFPPEDKEDFDISMTGQLEGIGALLSEEKGYIKVSRIIVGGAAWHQKGLESEDIILKVAQNKQEPVSIVDLPLRDAVKLIRGKKNTLVHLTVKKPDNRIKTISIKRDVIVIEESYAKGLLIKSKDKKRSYGLISLPSFYRNFKNNKARNATEDVKSLLSYFKTKNIDGLIIDVRNNGGGSLKDAIEIAGQFIEKGPILQVKQKSGKINVLMDEDDSILFKGPMIVLINKLSGSASEILAAALQDYNRAIVLGSPHSFGKGSVQTIFNLDQLTKNRWQKASNQELGSVKLTIQKFYRITGDSTQYKGIHPDIVAPSIQDHLDIGEQNYEYALPFSKIKQVEWTSWSPSYIKEDIVTKSKERIRKSPAFKKTNDYISYLKTKNQAPTTISFNALLKDRKEKEQKKQAIKDLVHIDHKATFFKSNKAAKRDKDLDKTLKSDLVLQEALAIFNDINQTQKP